MSGINWQDFPPKDPSASPTEVAQIVSDAVDREYIYCRQFSLELLAKEESWSQHHLDKLTDKGRIEVKVWLKEKNPQFTHHISSSSSSLPRRSVDPLCSGCKEKVAGYPEAPHSIYCSKACRKSNRPPYQRFGPIHASAPSQSNGSISFHPDSFIESPSMPIEELLATPPLPPVEEVEAPPLLRGLLAEWVDKLTVGQLKSLMGSQHISRPRGRNIVKTDLVALVIEYYLEKSWEQFKNDLLSIGCQLANIDLI